MANKIIPTSVSIFLLLTNLKAASGEKISEEKNKENNSVKVEKPKLVINPIIAKNKAISPTLLTNNAFRAARFAKSRLYQKPIKRNEHNPTPSHPRNNKTKLSETTKKIIENINKERKEKKRPNAGSVFKYHKL